MDAGSILLILSAALLSAAFIARPFLHRQPQGGRAPGHGTREAVWQRVLLTAERERLIASLQDLDFDRQLGKIPEADYPIQRNALLSQGAVLLRQLDELDAPRKGPGAGAPEPVPADATTSEDELEMLIAARRRTRMERSARSCPGCGKMVHRSDRFCPRCGARL